MKKIRKSIVALICVAGMLFGLAVGANADWYEYSNLSQMLQAADLVIVGTVTQSDPVVEDCGEDVLATITITEVIAGNAQAGAAIVVSQMGSAWEYSYYFVEVGTTYLLFLVQGTQNPAHHFPLNPGQWVYRMDAAGNPVALLGNTVTIASLQYLRDLIDCPASTTTTTTTTTVITETMATETSVTTTTDENENDNENDGATTTLTLTTSAPTIPQTGTTLNTSAIIAAVILAMGAGYGGIHYYKSKKDDA